MKYRSKLYLALIAVSIISSTIGLFILFRENKKLVIEDFREKVLTAAGTTAALIDVDALKQITRHGDETLPAYSKIREQLQMVRSINQHTGTNIAYIYTLMPDPQDPTRLVYGVDADVNPREVYPIGYPYTDSDEKDIIAHKLTLWGSEDFSYDEYGAWFSATAPVLDKMGNYVATIGVYLTANEVINEIHNVEMDSLSALISALVLALIGAFILSRIVTRSLKTLHTSVRAIGKGNVELIPSLNTRDEFNDLAIEINKMISGLKERERLKLGFTRYVSQHVLEKILKTETNLKFEGERKKITVLFSDIRQFTLLAERLPPEDVVSILNQYFERMIEIIFANHGTLDKFTGDGVMVEFGAPLEDPNQEKNAVTAAVQMQAEITKLHEKWKLEGKPLIDIGIGIHTGLAIVGNIGSEKRTEYTAVGDTVNVAARLEQATKVLNTPILISETTYEAVKDLFSFQSLGPLSVAGRSEKINVYTLPLDHETYQVKF